MVEWAENRETLWAAFVLILCWPVFLPYAERLKGLLLSRRRSRTSSAGSIVGVNNSLPTNVTLSPEKVCLICQEFTFRGENPHRCDPDMLAVRMRMENYGSPPWRNYLADAGRVVGRAVAVGLVVSLPGWGAWFVVVCLLVLQTAETVILHTRLRTVDAGRDLAGQLPNPAAVASPSFRLVVEHVEVLRHKLGVEGTVVVVPNVRELSADRKTFFAAALPLTEKYFLLLLSGRVLDVPSRELSGVLAHELSHMKRPYRNTFLSIGDGWAFPLAVMAAICFVPLFGAVGAVAWGVLLGWAVQLMVLMLRRAEERQADTEAYLLCGEVYRDALLHMLELYPHLGRKDLWWRTEDVFSSHNSVPNRWHLLG